MIILLVEKVKAIVIVKCIVYPNAGGRTQVDTQHWISKIIFEVVLLHKWILRYLFGTSLDDL